MYPIIRQSIWSFKGKNLAPVCNLKLEQSYHLFSDEAEQVTGIIHAFSRIAQPMTHLHQSTIQIWEKIMEPLKLGPGKVKFIKKTK